LLFYCIYANVIDRNQQKQNKFYLESITMSVEHKAESVTFYPDMNLDQVVDAEIVDEEQSPEMPPVLEFDQLRLAVGVRERKKDSHAHTEDAVYINQQNQVFGVFDGAGGAGGNPSAASRVAAETVGESLSRTDMAVDTIATAEVDLKMAFQIGREAVDIRGEGGATVATAAKVYCIDGKAFLGVAHAGDTRAFLYNKESQYYRDLTPDQSRGNVIFNSLDSRNHFEPDHFLVTPLQSGDRLMLCSDGITGDYPAQFFSNEEYLDAFGQPTADAAAEKFMQTSLGEQKKRDDKSVLVIDFDTADNVTMSAVNESDEQPKENSNESEATRRSVTKRKESARLLRKSLGLPDTATAEEVSEARKAQRSSSAQTPDDINMMEAFAGDTELQQQIKEAVSYKSGYTVNDKRVWDRATGKIKVPIVPPKPDYLPTNHLKFAATEQQGAATEVTEETPTEAISIQPEQDVSTVEKLSWKDKMSHPFRHLASQMSAYHAIQRNKLEERYTSEQLSERERKQVIALKAVWGAAALALVFAAGYKLGMHDTHGLIDPSDIPVGGGRQSSDPIPVEKIPAPVRPPEFSVAASTVTSGEGWYQTIQEATGVTDPARQAAILQKIGPVLQEKGWAYLMSDGKWGIDHPGVLPRDVLELIKNSQ
jgi:serine/threonine protein phosphatase PrpC